MADILRYNFFTSDISYSVKYKYYKSGMKYLIGEISRFYNSCDKILVSFNILGFFSLVYSNQWEMKREQEVDR